MKSIWRSQVLVAFAIVTMIVVLGCSATDATPAGSTPKFNDRIEKYTPDVNISGVSSGREIDLDTEGMQLDQVNPLSQRTTIEAGQAGTFSISFARFSEAKGVFEEQARCNGKPNAIALTRPISEIPNVILKILSSDRDSAFNCKTTKGIIIDVDNVGFIETEGTTVRVVLRADKKATIAVFSGHVVLTPQDEYESEPISISEHTEVLIDFTEREILPPTPATFSIEEDREFEVLEESIQPTDGTDPPETEPPPTSIPGQDATPKSTPTPTAAPTSTPAPTDTPISGPAPTDAPISTPAPTDAPAPTPTDPPTSTPAPTPKPTSTLAPTPTPVSDHKLGHRHLFAEQENGGVAADLVVDWFASPGGQGGLEWVFQLRADVLTADNAALTCPVVMAILEAQKDEITDYVTSWCLDELFLQIRTSSENDSFLVSVSSIEIPILVSE